MRDRDVAAVADDLDEARIGERARQERDDEAVLGVLLREAPSAVAGREQQQPVGRAGRPGPPGARPRCPRRPAGPRPSSPRLEVVRDLRQRPDARAQERRAGAGGRRARRPAPGAAGSHRAAEKLIPRPGGRPRARRRSRRSETSPRAGRARPGGRRSAPAAVAGRAGAWSTCGHAVPPESVAPAAAPGARGAGDAGAGLAATGGPRVSRQRGRRPGTTRRRRGPRARREPRSPGRSRPDGAGQRAEAQRRQAGGGAGWRGRRGAARTTISSWVSGSRLLATIAAAQPMPAPRMPSCGMSSRSTPTITDSESERVDQRPRRAAAPCSAACRPCRSRWRPAWRRRARG